MKSIKFLIILFLAVMLLSSCASRTNIVHSRFDEILDSHANILDVNRSKMYHLTTIISLELYLSTYSYNAETVSAVRDDLMQFLRDDVEEILEILGSLYARNVDIIFFATSERGEREIFHQVWIETESGIQGEWEITYYWRD